MDPETIKRIAAEVGHYLPDYRWTLTLQVAVTAIVAGLAAYWGDYFKTRGKNLATKADFEMLLDQLHAQTSMVETIKSEVSRKDWAARQWSEVRRIKLEELLNKGGEFESRLERMWRSSGDLSKIPIERDPADDFRTLGIIYFPELRNEIDACLSAYRKLVVEAAKYGLTDPKSPTYGEAYEKFIAHREEALPKFYAARRELEDAARKLVVKIMDVDDGQGP
jgi:hypothetical protein